MQITIYKNFSKEVNSTKQPSGGTAVSCTLKEDTSLLHPVFILQGADFDVNYVSWGSRYYFVDDIVSIRNGAVELHCSVDPLASFKTEIGASSQYVTRSAHEKNGHVVDTMYPMTSESYRNVTLFTKANSAIQATNGCYIIGVVGSASTTGVTYYILDDTQFASFVNYMFQGSFLNAPTQEISVELQKEIVNPFQYVLSAMWLPLQLVGNPDTIHFGYWDSNISANTLTASLVDISDSFTLPTHMMETYYGDYMSLSPYTELKMVGMTMGETPLDPTPFVSDKTGFYQFKVDPKTGTADLYIYKSSSKSLLLAHNTFQLGVTIPIGQSASNLIGSAVGVLGSVGALAQGNFMGVISGIGDVASGLLPQVQKSGSQGSRSGFDAPFAIISTFRQVTPKNVLKVGAPLMATRTISALPGFNQVEKPDVDISGTPEEKQAIINYMTSGFYYE